MNVTIQHPWNPRAITFGRMLMVGERLQKGDLYPGPKEWQEIQESIIGEVIQVGHPTLLVRPEPVVVAERRRPRLGGPAMYRR